jgi:hypothetical protein
VLENGKSVLLLSGSEEQVISDRRVDFAAVKYGRLVNRAEEGEIVHPREEILAAVYSLGEALELRALTQKVGTHRDYDKKVR